MFLLRLLLPALVLLAAGCANKVYVTDLEPDVAVAASRVGEGRALHIAVTDSRPGEAFARHGVGNATVGSGLQSRQPVADVVRSELLAAMQRKGFQVSASGLNASRTMQVTIEAFDILPDENDAKAFVFRGVFAVRATGWSANFDKRFTSERRESRFLGIDPDESAPWVNAILGDLLGRIANDPQLLNALLN